MREQAEQAIKDVAKEIDRPIRDVLIQQITKANNQREREQRQAEQAQAQEQARPTPRPPQPKPIPQPQNDAKTALIKKLENRHNPYEQGEKEYFKAVREYASQLQQKEFAKIKAEIKAIKEKTTSRANQRVFYEQENPSI